MQGFGTLIANTATFTANESATAGAWAGIYVSYEAYTDIGNITLNNCIVEYATSIYVRRGNLNLTNNTVIKDFSGYGVDVYTAGTLNMDMTAIQSCSYPVYFRDKGGNGHWTVGSGVDLTGNTNDYVFIDFRDVNSDFTLPDVGIPYYYNSELRVTATGNLKIDPGVILQGNTSAYIAVYGKLKALGTTGSPIEFTKHPDVAHWRGMNFLDAAIDTACILTNCKFTGANYTYSNYRPYEIPYVALEIIESSPVITDCEFSGNRYNLVVTGRSYPVFTSCSFLESILVSKQTMNINIDMNAEPVFTSCSMAFNASESRAVGIIGSTIYGDSHMKQLSFTGIDNITYTLQGNVIVQDTASIVIDPGIVIKCMVSSYYLQSNGALSGIGTVSEPIVFTHINDDNFGSPADTHNDGTIAIPNSASGRLILNSQENSTIDHWKIIYGGQNTSYYAVYAYKNAVVKNCEISYSHRGILFMGDAQLLNNTLDYIATYPYARRMNVGAPVMIGNTISNSGNLGIYVHDFLEGTYSIGGFDIGSTTNVAYIVDSDNPIPTTAKVSIEPGTVFKYTNYGKLSVRGGLDATGAKTNKIIFTSIYDNSVSGNTNFNTGADPTGYKWNGVEFFDSSDDGMNKLKNCEVRYVANSIRMTNCMVLMDSMLLNFSNNYAVSVFGSANPVITNCAFNNLSAGPVYMDMFADPTFSGNSIANVAQIGIRIRGGEISGTIPQRSFAGYDNITYLMYENFTVNDELNIPAGIVFKGSGSAYFNIYGTLNILGTEQDPVILTSLTDDAYGNPMDTQLNGQAAISKSGNRIVIRDEANDASVINHVISRYSYDYAIYMASASPTIKNSTFYNTNRCGLYLVGTAAPTVDSCTFDELDFPIITSLLTYPGSHQGNVISGRTARAILIIDNETLTQNYTLNKQSFAGIANIPYLFDRFNVGTSAILTISPGIVLKFRQNGYMNVRNGLIAEGGSTPDSTIVFTADRDDFYGGDTYADGDANLSHDYWWYGVSFLQESIDASCSLNNCIIKNGSRYYTSGANVNNRGAVTIDNASPSIQNCLFEKNYRAIIVRNTSLPLISDCDFVETNRTYGYAVWNETGTVTVEAKNCWWNDASGPYHATLNPGGLGERVSNNVDFTPWISQTAKPIKGDVSLNGEVMPYDASLVLQHTVGNIVLDAKQLTVADVSGDLTVSSFDASLILQYTIGLITNFEQSAKKALSGLADLMVSGPENFVAEPGSHFEIPISFTTPETVKSIDMQFNTDPRHLKFIGLNSENLPTDMMLASGYNDSTGVLKISFTSAYDLDLNYDELQLIFEIKDEQVETSAIELTKLLANETTIEDDLLTIIVENQTSQVGIEGFSGLNSFNVYGAGEQIIADIYLAEEQSQLLVTVYDLAGRSLNKLLIENPKSGKHKFYINPEFKDPDRSFRICLVNIRGDDFVETRKVVLR